jgi:hypothetical protein
VSVNSLAGTVTLDAAAVGAYPDTNPSGFVDAAGAASAAPVQSVNGAIGTVVLGAGDVGAYPDTNPSNFIDAAGAPVQSVNTLTGTVVLDAAAVGAYPDTNPSAFVDAAGAAAAAPVQSVNGFAGTVSLDTDDVPEGTALYFTGQRARDETFVVAGTEPSNTDVIWFDTSEPGDAVLPVGGLAGQSLVKASGSDYDATWEDRARIVNTDGEDGKTFYVGSVDPDGVFTLEVGDVWIEVPS